MVNPLPELIRTSTPRLAAPIGVNPGLKLIGATVRQAVSDPQVQGEAVLALHERFQTPFLLTAMDLSAEAEAFGAAIRLEDSEVPTVIGRLLTDTGQIEGLRIPQPGEKRMRVHLETAHRLSLAAPQFPVLGGMIGPFSLAGRLFGVSESLELTLTEPEAVHRLLAKVTGFLIGYALAFRESGAQGVIMAEPAAGLLSPRGMEQFSSAYISQIISAVQRPEFTLVLHNCGARPAHLAAMRKSEASILHFGAPMDVLKALEQVPGEVVIGGNLDPSAVFLQGTPELVRQKTLELLAATSIYANFFISSGCDLPPGTPVENLAAFFEAVQT